MNAGFACIGYNKIVDLVVKGKGLEWARHKYRQYRQDILILFASIIKQFLFVFLSC